MTLNCKYASKFNLSYYHHKYSLLVYYSRLLVLYVEFKTSNRIDKIELKIEKLNQTVGSIQLRNEFFFFLGPLRNDQFG